MPRGKPNALPPERRCTHPDCRFQRIEDGELCGNHSKGLMAQRVALAVAEDEAARTEVYAIVRRYFKGDEGKTELWMRTPNLSLHMGTLGNVTPAFFFACRQGPKLLRIIKEALATVEMMHD